MRIQAWPNNAKMAFAIRDDDISFFTPPGRLQLLYSYAIDNGFKISYSVIPMHMATADLNVPPAYRQKMTSYSVAKNEPLVNYLTKMITRGQADILQHGYSHSGNRKHSQLTNDSINNKLIEGKLILEKTFDITVEVFVPPWESLAKSVSEQISSAEMSLSMAPIKFVLLNKFSMIQDFPKIIKASYFAFTKRSLFQTEIMEINSLLNIGSLYNHVASRHTNPQSAERSFKHFERILDETYSRGGCLVIGNHYWQYYYDWEESITNHLLKTYLDKVIESVGRRKRIWKAGLTEISRWTRAKKALRIDTTREKTIVSAIEPIEGLTIRLSASEEITADKPFSYSSEPEEDDVKIAVVNLGKKETVCIKKKA